jgi:outer membrane protein assembly factor BamB
VPRCDAPQSSVLRYVRKPRRVNGASTCCRSPGLRTRERQKAITKLWGLVPAFRTSKWATVPRSQRNRSMRMPSSSTVTSIRLMRPDSVVASAEDMNTAAGRPEASTTPRRSLSALRVAIGTAIVAAVIVAALLLPDGGGSSWTQPNADIEGTRAVAAGLDASNVARLQLAWRAPLTATPAAAGLVASTPLVEDDRVFLQDLRSNVHAFDRASGALLWSRRYGAESGGPNGIALEGGRIFGATDTTAFALDADDGRELWKRRLVTPTEQFVDVAPVVADGSVYTGTVGYPPGGKGAIYALDAEDGSIRWKRSTIQGEWAKPREAGGGGIWYPVSLDGQGRLYAGTANPAPWGGRGGAFPGPALYTDSLLALDADTGELLWYDQVTPHDVRDYDFQLTPIVWRGLVIGGGKAGRVIAWDRQSRQRVWEARVGLHLNDEGPLPPRRVRVCPGLLGGVETPMALAEGRLFVPVVDLCAHGSATGYDRLSDLDPMSARGRLVALDAASGRRLWERRFGSAVFGCATVSRDVVFTATYDGRIYGLSAKTGRTLWSTRARAGVNACPAVEGDLLVIGAGVPHPSFPSPASELVAFRLGG